MQQFSAREKLVDCRGSRGESVGGNWSRSGKRRYLPGLIWSWSDSDHWRPDWRVRGGKNEGGGGGGWKHDLGVWKWQKFKKADN